MHALARAVHGAREQRLQVVLNTAGRHGGVQAGFDVGQVKACVGMALRAADLGLLHVVRQVVAQALLQHLHEALVQLGHRVVGPQGLGLRQGARLVEPMDQVPGGQVKKHAAGHLAPLRPQVAVAQQRHYQVQAELLVKVGAAHVHAAGGQHVVPAVGQAHALRPQAHHGEVRGAAAHVHHQHGLFAVQAALVVQGRRDGFELKSHFCKPDRLRRLLQRRLRQRVARRVVVHKMHGPAHHHARGRAAQAVRGTLAQRGQKGGDDVLKADLPVVDLGRF